MPYGPFGNLFPYSDQHALNLDWIIQVAKDFLDQYTHIQEIISNGEESLDQHTTDGLAALAAEKDRLEGLLNAWYITHSNDIADQLTAAVASFGTQAAAIGADVIASIPEDYTALSATVTGQGVDILTKDIADMNIFNNNNVIDTSAATSGYRISTSTGQPVSNTSYSYTDYIAVRPGMVFKINHVIDSASYGTAFYDSSKTFISGSGVSGTRYSMVVPAGAAYMRTTYKNTFASSIAGYLSYPDTDDLQIAQDIAHHIYTPVHINIQQGGLSTSTGAGTSSDQYVRASEFYQVTKVPLIIKVKPGYKVGYRIYSEASTEGFLYYSSMNTSDFYIPVSVGQYIKFVIGKTDNTNLEPAEVINYDPVCILNMSPDMTNDLAIPTAEATKYGIDSLNNFITEATGVRNYIWEIGYIPTSSETVNRTDVRYSSNWRHAVVPCSEGDRFYIYAIQCISDRRPFSFIDSSGNVLSQATRNSAQNEILTAPASAEYLVCNSGPSEIYGWNCSLHTLLSDPTTQDGQDIRLKIQQLAQARRVSRVYQTPPLVLLHFSDIHADVDNFRRIMTFYNNYSNYIHDVIHTGDSVDYEFSDGFTSWWETVPGHEKVLNLIGNHDSNTRIDGNPSWYSITAQEDYETFIGPYIENWGATYTENLCYYYKDYPTNNVRLICLDPMHMTEDQLTWFTNTLADARTNGLHVLVANHFRGHWPETAMNSPFNDTFMTENSSPSFSPNYKEYMPTAWSDAIDDFKEAGGYFIAWIAGHTHYDVFTRLDRHPDQVQICVGLAGIKYAITSAAKRVRDTKSQDLFNVIGIDTYSKVIKIARVGTDYNLMMQHKDVLCYNYDTDTLIV